MKLFKRYESVTREELETFIGPMAKKPFFNRALNNYMENPNKATWCWASFLVGTFWLIYRKLLIAGFVLFLLEIISSLFLPMIVSPFLSMLLFIFLGFYGVNIYLTIACKRILKLKNSNVNLDKETLNTYIKNAGGTSLFYVIAVYLIIQLTLNLFI